MINKNYRLSVMFLIIANLVPIIGTLFFGWNVFDIIFIYWCESGIIGFFNILKILIKTRPIFFGIFLSIFFTIHFGGFMFGHLMFIFTLFPNQNIVIESLSPLIYSISALFISHLISFISNFILKEEYKSDINLSNFDMLPPYKRIFIMQFVIVFGSFIITLFNQPVIAVILLIIIKTIIDINSHIKSHDKINLNLKSKV